MTLLKTRMRNYNEVQWLVQWSTKSFYANIILSKISFFAMASWGVHNFKNLVLSKRRFFLKNDYCLTFYAMHEFEYSGVHMARTWTFCVCRTQIPHGGFVSQAQVQCLTFPACPWRHYNRKLQSCKLQDGKLLSCKSHNRKFQSWKLHDRYEVTILQSARYYTLIL